MKPVKDRLTSPHPAQQPIIPAAGHTAILALVNAVTDANTKTALKAILETLGVDTTP